MVLAIALACSLQASGEVAAQIPPPQFSKSALLNGMEIFFLPNTESRSRFVLMIQNGAAFDPIDKWGVTQLTIQMMLEQTERRTGEQLRQDLNLLGARLEARVDWDAIYFSGSVPPERLGDALNVLAEVIVRPSFREEVFERLRREQVEAVQASSDRPAVRTQTVFQRELFQLNPYGHSVEGTTETLQSLLLNDVRIQYRKLFVPNEARLAVTHSGDQVDLFRTLARGWGSWVRGDPAPFTFRQAQNPAQNRALVMDAPGGEGWLRVGALSVARSQPEFFELEVLQHYLTLTLTDWAKQVTSQSQIQASVRLETRRLPGFLQLSVQAPSEQLAEYAFRFRDLIGQLQRGEIEAERFKEAKELAFLELRRRLEDPEQMLEQILNVHLYGVGVSFLTTYGIRLDRVQPSRFQSVLKEVLSPTSLLLVAAGNGSSLRGRLQDWGEVEVLN